MSYSRKLSPNTESPLKGSIPDQSNRGGGSLIEEWPHNYLALQCPKKVVTFSEYSEMRVYYDDTWFQPKKSYTNDDRKHFQVQAAYDASRIRNIVSTYPLHTERAIRHAIGLGLIKHEEIVGIEHLVSEKAATNLMHERRAHVALVLRAQELMQVKYANAVQNPVILAKVASRSSSRSVERARVRAASSMNNEKSTLDSCFQRSMRFKAVKKPIIRGAFAA